MASPDHQAAFCSAGTLENRVSHALPQLFIGAAFTLYGLVKISPTQCIIELSRLLSQQQTPRNGPPATACTHAAKKVFSADAAKRPHTVPGVFAREGRRLVGGVSRHSVTMPRATLGAARLRTKLSGRPALHVAYIAISAC